MYCPWFLPGSEEARRLVFWDPTGREGLLDVEPEDCDLIVFVVKYKEGFCLTADAVERASEEADGWYSFIEFWQNDDPFEVIGEAVPSCARLARVDQELRWVFDSAEAAEYWALRVADDGLAVKRRYSATLKPTALEELSDPMS